MAPPRPIGSRPGSRCSSSSSSCSSPCRALAEEEEEDDDEEGEENEDEDEDEDEAPEQRGKKKSRERQYSNADVKRGLRMISAALATGGSASGGESVAKSMQLPSMASTVCTPAASARVAACLPPTPRRPCGVWASGVVLWPHPRVSGCGSSEADGWGPG